MPPTIPQSAMIASAVLLSMPTVILLVAAIFAGWGKSSLLLVGSAIVLLLINLMLLRFLRRWAIKTMEDSSQ